MAFKLVCAWVVFLVLGIVGMASAGEPRWQRLSSKQGQLPVPGESIMQTGAVAADFDKDGVNDFVLSFRGKAPALVWYRRKAEGWDRFVIEQALLPIEAGGAVHDIDGDGDPDLVFGGDWQGPDVWWWENPAPRFDADVSWRRHTIKKGGKTQHHDQAFGDLLGTGRPQLAFWNQNAKTIFLAGIPSDPRNAESWPLTAIYSGSAGEEGRNTFRYPEGMSVFEIDGDGNLDVFCAEMAKWREKQPLRDHPDATAWILYGDGKGNFRTTELVKGEGWHEARVADLDGDGDMDILNKPYTWETPRVDVWLNVAKAR